jgi:hypothetical protein
MGACNGSDDPAPAATRLAGQASNNATAAPLDDYVSITLVPDAGGANIPVPCDAQGRYSVEIPAGTYTLMATRVGYQDYQQAGVNVVADTTTPLDFNLVPLAANTYISSLACSECHATRYAEFRRTGHPYKINKVVNNQVPTYPFSSIAGALAMIADDNGETDNTLGTPMSYAEVPYVIGGFGWKARFMDADGFIVTGSEVQYNLATQSMVSYHNDETDKPFNCGNCHTTGWRHYDGTLNNNRQDNLPGMDGTFAEPGIQCEACHGAGSTHAQTMSRNDIVEVASPRTTAQLAAADAGYGRPIACGECHTRDGEKDYGSLDYVSQYTTDGGLETLGGRIAASGGLIKHHEQYDELLGVDPANVNAGSTRSANFKSNHLDCMTCHNPHTTTRYQDDVTNPDPNGVNKANADCLACHGNKDMSGLASAMKNFNCIDCHMPKMAKSAMSHPATGNGPTLGDIKTHIFTIDMSKDSDTEQFNGSFANPWITAKFACWQCHNSTGTAHDRTAMDDSGYTFHN